MEPPLLLSRCCPLAGPVPPTSMVASQPVLWFMVQPGAWRSPYAVSSAMYLPWPVSHSWPWCLDWSIPRTEHRSGLQRGCACPAAHLFSHRAKGVINLSSQKRMLWKLLDKHPHLYTFLYSVNRYCGPALHRLQSWVQGPVARLKRRLPTRSSQSSSTEATVCPGQAVPAFLSQLCYLLAWWSWAGHLAYLLSLSFLIWIWESSHLPPRVVAKNKSYCM